MTKKSELDSKLFAFLATFLTIVGFIIALIAKRDDKYVMHYAKQGLLVFIGWIIASLVGALFTSPWGYGYGIHGLLNLFVAVFWVISWVYALSGKEKEIPIFGKYARKINL